MSKRQHFDIARLEALRKLICDTYESHVKISGGQIRDDYCEEYEQAMLSILRLLSYARSLPPPAAELQPPLDCAAAAPSDDAMTAAPSEGATEAVRQLRL